MRAKIVHFLRFWSLLVVLSTVTAGCDLWTKHWAAKNLSTPNVSAQVTHRSHAGPTIADWQNLPTSPQVLVANHLDLFYAENHAGAFSLGLDQSRLFRRLVLIIGGIGAIALILHLYARTLVTQRLSQMALAVVLGGGIGNFVDRIHRGYVVDFIHAHWYGRYHWPTFNVADIAVVVGILGFFLAQYWSNPNQATPATAK